ncbi:hypothetical protein Dd703_2609 [Musicola paradisiaca Ech703]|uniref:Uncharacterized protein n=1 Tax=Musicola paradisiaca (strain Ech703) TaxID=579405 RepID=C6C9W4_MUSP7|nr:hypothetical protein Dd703_2609 [Musicola paradisiaca Ech703]
MRHCPVGGARQVFIAELFGFKAFLRVKNVKCFTFVRVRKPTDS